VGKLKAPEYKQFEDIKRVHPDGSEYWLARELATILDYTQWRNFAKVIDKATIACQNSGHDIDDHFAEVSKMIRFLISWAARSLPPIYSASHRPRAN
jgi:DNA-damage-inducible protein D